MQTSSKRAATALVVVAVVCCAFITPLRAQPSSGWVGEGAQDLGKTVFVEIFKKTLPGGEIVANTSDWVIDPLVTASTTPGTANDRLDAYLLALGQAGLNAAWPAYGITLSTGKILIGGVFYTVEQMIAGTKDQQAMAVLTGQLGLVGGINNPVSRTPFLDLPIVKNRGITFENLGARVTSGDELKRLWYETYGRQLRDIFGPGQAQATLDEYWPHLLKVWQMQRAKIAAESLVAALDKAVRAAREARERPVPDSAVASAGSCRLAGDWRATHQTAFGQHRYNWTILSDGRAIETQLAARGFAPEAIATLQGRTLNLVKKDNSGNLTHLIVELDKSCTRGEGTMLTTWLGGRRSEKVSISWGRIGDASPVVAATTPTPVTQAPTTPTPVTPAPTTQPRPDAIQAPGGTGPIASPPAPATQGSPAPRAPAPAQTGNACGHTLGSGILAKWQQLGGERGILGCPTMSEAPANRSPQGSTGVWANFQHGLITWMFTGPKVTQGFEVHGAIKNLYVQMGGTGSWLGFAMSDEYDVPGGRRSDFEGGHIVWDRATNQARAERPGAVTAGHLPPGGGAPGTWIAQAPPAKEGHAAAPAAPRPACEASGVWQAATEGIGNATWTLQPVAPGRYAAREQGLGNATGTGVVSGSRLRIDWTTGGYAGFYEWDLGVGCTGGGGTLVFSQGRGGRHGSRIARSSVPSQPPPAMASAVYKNPQIGGIAVDHCATWASNCGQGGADQFCRTQGHARASGFQVYSPGRTYVMGDRRVCEGGSCVGLSQVVCAR